MFVNKKTPNRNESVRSAPCLLSPINICPSPAVLRGMTCLNTLAGLLTSGLLKKYEVKSKKQEKQSFLYLMSYILILPSRQSRKASYSPTFSPLLQVMVLSGFRFRLQRRDRSRISRDSLLFLILRKPTYTKIKRAKFEWL